MPPFHPAAFPRAGRAAEKEPSNTMDVDEATLAVLKKSPVFAGIDPAELPGLLRAQACGKIPLSMFLMAL